MNPNPCGKIGPARRLASLCGLALAAVSFAAPISYDLTDAATAALFHGPGVTITPAGLQADGGNDVPRVQVGGLNVDVAGRQWLIVRMSSTKGPYGGFTFTTAANATQSYVFPIVSDGRMHTYNVFIGTETLTKSKIRPSDFKGVITAFTVFATYEPGASGTVQRVEFRDEPDGSPGVFVPEYTGAVDALNRVGRPGPVAVRFRNAGGKPLTGIKAEFSAAAALRLTGGWRGIPDRLDPDTMVTIIADVLPLAVGRHDFSVKLTDADGDAVEAPGFMIVDPALKDIEEFANLQPGVIPPPRPLKIPGYEVGSLYFPGWSHLNHWPSIPPFIERRPEYGYFDEGSPDAADWTIKWAVEHGISFFNILQYWQGGRQANTPFLEQGFLKAKFLSYVQFFETWSNDGAQADAGDFVRCMQYIVDTCFSYPNYKKSPDGRHFLGVLNGATLVREMGGIRKVEELMAQIEAYAKSKGSKGIFWIVGGGSAKYRDNGFDGFFYYNAPRAGSKYPASPAPTLVAAQHTYWGGITAPGALTLLPISTGFDHRPWFGKTPRNVRYQFTPDLLVQGLRDGKKYVDSIGQHTLLIECWSEWGEGSCLGPQGEHGFEMLKAIPRALAPDEPLRPVLVPRDIGMTLPEIPGIWNEVPRPPIDDRRP